MKDSVYHVLLRVSVLTCALILIFDSGALSPVTKQLSLNTQQYLAQSVGVGASVRSSELNNLTGQLSQRQRDLDAREASLEDREINVGLNAPAERVETNVSTYILSTILFILIVLIVLNYALDFARERRLIHEKRISEAA